MARKRDPYSFWYILLTAKKREDMFYVRFDKKMVPRGIQAVEDPELDT